MVSFMKTDARAAAGLLVLSVAVAATLAGCRSSGGMSDRSSRTSSYSSVSTGAQGAEASAAPEEDLTATESATETAPMPADSGATDSSSILRPDAPKSYVVKRGDTLWDISSMFLKDPWLWPEVWIINPQVENPHLIYPGDTLALAFGANGNPQIRLQSGGAA